MTNAGLRRQGSKVPSGRVGRTWLCYSYHTLLRLPGGCFELRLACFFPWFLVFTLLISSGVFFFVFLFSSFFSSSATFPAGKHGSVRGSTTVFYYTRTRYVFFFFSFDLLSLFFFLCFLLFFLSFIECVCRACHIQYDDMAVYCLLLLCLLHTWYQVPGM